MKRQLKLPPGSNGLNCICDTEGRPLPLASWLCQPYVRVPLEEHTRRCLLGQQREKEGNDTNGCNTKRPLKDVDRLQDEMKHLSKKKAKKLLRNPRKKFPATTVGNFNLCICRSPRVSNLILIFKQRSVTQATLI